MDDAECRELVAEAERLLDRDSDDASRIATEILAQSAAIGDEASSIAHRVLAVTALRRGNTDEASRSIDEAVAAGERSHVDVVLGKALMTAMAVAASTGDPRGALELGDRADSLLPSELRIRLAIQRGSVLIAGFSAVDEAIAVFDGVLAEHSEIPSFEHGILRLNRGTQLLRRGDLMAAADDFALAAADFRSIPNRRYETASMLHLALSAARMGDLPAVFEIHRDLTDDDALSESDPHDFLDLAQCLMIAGLLSEARDLVDRAVELGQTAGVSEFSVQVELMAARVQRLLGLTGAGAAWETARRSAEELGLDEVIALVDVEGAAVHRSDRERGPDVPALRAAADALALAGHRRDALDAEIEILRWAFDEAAGWPSGSGPMPDPLAADLTPFDRAQVRHHRALCCCLAGDRAQARRELIAGIRDIEAARASIAAADVRAAASDRAPEMAALGLRLAVAAGRPRPVLEWGERVRATALRLADPSGQGDLADELERLRRADGNDRAEVTAIEHRIRRRARTGRTTRPVVRPASAGEICSAVGRDRVLLEYLEVDGDLRLCVVSRYRAHEVDLGVTVRDVAESVGKILFGLRRMASSSGRPADPAADMVRQLAARVAATILPDRWLGASEYVVVPTGPLHHLPWAVLAPFAATPFVVAPSAHVWCSIAQRSHGLRRVVVATGPGLPEAEAELRDVKAVWGSRATEVMAASAGDLRAELPGAGIAHVCCHGRFRTDSPQFSALEMADGPFTVFDLEGLDQLPSLMVLSACSLGSVDVRLGNDLLGFPAALFARGVATLVASVLPVEDAATRVLMTEMHASLASGTSPAAALRDARSAVNELGPSHAAAAASFLCFGRG